MSGEAAARRRAIRDALEEAIARASEALVRQASTNSRGFAASQAAAERVEQFELALARAGYFVGTIREVQQ